MQFGINELFIIFMLYSFFGWMGEMLGKLIFEGKYINRGFLIGPYCPIYGCGGILLIILLKKYFYDPLTMFIMCILLFSILEYLTSYIMEKLFNARWWDYTKYKFNINGRICLETMIPFGMFGIIAMYIVNPFFYKCFNNMPNELINIISLFLLIIFITDLIVSIFIMINIKNTIKKVKLDNTEEITNIVKELLLKKNVLKRRIIKAFPKLKIK